MNTRRTGDLGEEIALRHLSSLGYDLVKRNYRTRYGEIDLILRDGETIVFVEVKLRRDTGYGDPLDSVTTRKQEQVRAIAEQYLNEIEPEFEALRFDVVGILARGGRPEITHVQNAF